MAFTVTVGGNDITSKVRIASVAIRQNARDMVATCSFECLDSGATLAIVAKDAVVIDDGATVYFKGEVAGTPARQEIAPNTLRWEVDCQDYNQLLKETVVDAAAFAAASSDANVVIPGLFTTFRNDIDSSTYVSEVDASMEVLEFEAQTLAETMRDIGDMTGARFWADFDKKLHYGETPGTNADGLSDNPDEVNTFRYWGLERHSDIGIINRVYVKGRGVDGWVENAASIATYGERETVIRDRHVTTSQGVTDRGTAIINANKDPTITYSLITIRSGFSVGENIELTSSVYSLTDEALFCVEIVTTFLTGSKPRYEITLGHEIDDVVTRYQQQQDEDGGEWAAGHVILLYDAAKDIVVEYPATSAGLDDAGSDASAGDVIWLPVKAISGDHTLIADVHYVGLSRWATVLTGQITLAAGTTLETMTVQRTANDGNNLKGVVAPASGVAKLRDCSVECTQSGAGGAFAVAVESGGSVESWGCCLDGDSTSGNGYAGYITSGNLYVYGGRCYGSTDEFN